MYKTFSLYLHTSHLTLRKIAIWLSKNCQKLEIFCKKLPKIVIKKLSMATSILSQNFQLLFQVLHCYSFSLWSQEIVNANLLINEAYIKNLEGLSYLGHKRKKMVFVSFPWARYFSRYLGIEQVQREIHAKIHTDILFYFITSLRYPFYERRFRIC